MDTADVVIVGGGPAGSACAWKLHEAGVDVVIVDRAAFPRDKVCAGWITPPVLDELGIDRRGYARGRTFQPITGFRVGAIGSRRTVDIEYGGVVSFGIRRLEFDEYLLRRSGARVQLGSSADDIRHGGRGWIINESVTAPMLVGAGGHFCPVARMLNGPAGRESVVAAQEVELPIEQCGCEVSADTPELYFAADLAGYGWCFRKGAFVNIGFGRIGARALPAATADFVRFLAARGRIAVDASRLAWRGHAYRLAEAPWRRAVDSGVLVIGDAAGLADPRSGEGIRPAIESGLRAAHTIIQADGSYDVDRLSLHEACLNPVPGLTARAWSRLMPLPPSAALCETVAPWLLDNRWFVRHIVLDRWFLHRR